MTDWRVPFVNPQQLFVDLETELMAAVRDVLAAGKFIRGDVEKFERNMEAYLGVDHVVGVNSGTDALHLALKARDIGSGDEVITVAHSFVATTSAIQLCGATPVFVDIGNDFNMDVGGIERLVTDRTKAILPVHLNGRLCDMDKIMYVARTCGIYVVEDACQALGATYDGTKAGAFGEGCFSLHFMKILHGAGNGGFYSTNDGELAERVRILKDNGQRTKTDLVCVGYNSRLDNLQAAIANVKFPYIDRWIKRRRDIATRYDEGLQGLSLDLPHAPSDNGRNFDVFNSYVVMTDRRDELRKHLRDKGIEVFSHIDRPLYSHVKLGLNQTELPNNERICGRILSLPIDPVTTDDQVGYVIESVRGFFGE